MNKQLPIRLLSILLLLHFSWERATAQASSEADPWQMLEKELANRQLVALGEDGHGYETYNQAKTKLLSFLNEKLGYRKLIFESSFTEGVISFLNGDPLEKRMNRFVYPFWNTPSVREGLRPFYKEEQRTSEPALLGCDIQEDCRYVLLSDYLLQKGWIKERKAQLLSCDSLLNYYIGKMSARSVPAETEYRLLVSHYDEVIEEVRNHHSLTGLKKKLVLRCLENRKWLCHYLTIKRSKERMYFRDSLMAENVQWLRKELPGSNRLVLWTTNLHAARMKPDAGNPQWMGEWLDSALHVAYFPIAFGKKKILSGTAAQLSDGLFIKYGSNDQPFSVNIYCDKIVKIKKEEWNTRCE